MYPTLVHKALPALARPGAWPHKIALVFCAAGLLVLSAKISIPFYPVPMNLQTFAILVMGMVLGLRLGLLTVLFYLLLGALGLPVFSGTPQNGSGLDYMLGPTGGYLVGFVLAVGFLGVLAHRGWDRSFVKTAVAMLMANILIYVPGLLWLGYLFGLDVFILRQGLYPFLFGDALKLILAATILPFVWNIMPNARQ